MHYGVGVVPARPYKPRDKAYASYCTSCEPCRMFSGTPTFGEFDALCFSRRIGSWILIQPVVSIIHRIAAKQAAIPPGDHALGPMSSRTDISSSVNKPFSRSRSYRVLSWYSRRRHATMRLLKR